MINKLTLKEMREYLYYTYAKYFSYREDLTLEEIDEELRHIAFEMTNKEVVETFAEVVRSSIEVMKKISGGILNTNEFREMMKKGLEMNS